MKDQTEQVLASLLERAVQGIDEAVAFSQAQVPDVVEQLLLWKAVESGIWFSCGFLFILAIFLFWRWVLPKVIEEYKLPSLKRRESIEFFVPMAGTLVSMTMGSIAITMMARNLDWLKILIAPKLYLLEYAAKLVG